MYPVFSRRVAEFIEDKVSIQHVTLREAQFHARGIVLNEIEDTTVLPDDGRYYVKDGWFSRRLGFREEQYLPLMATVGKLILPREDRKLLVVRG